MKLGILVPVWRDYQWIAPLTMTELGRRWPSHPEVWFCGLEASCGLPALPLTADRSNWTQVLLEGVRHMRSLGFDRIYLILEEHLPLGPCHEEHLNATLPALMDSLPASYISLMGWDNRRFTSRSRVLGNDRHQLKHLTGPNDPRFHLHPALWESAALEQCAALAVEVPDKNGSAWHFEKSSARATFPGAEQDRCYQIRASSLSAYRPAPGRRLAGFLDRVLYQKLMALCPLIPGRDASNRFFRSIPFDDVFCAGPYPMVFSGILAKGALNRFFAKHVGRSDPALMKRILSAMPRT